MTRRTSNTVYDEIRTKGLLGRLQFQVYDALYHNGPLTQNELHKEFFPETQPRNIQPRVSELQARGVVSCVCERPCRITGRVCLAWDVNERLPLPPVKNKSTRKLIEELWAEVNALKMRVDQPRFVGDDRQGRLCE